MDWTTRLTLDLILPQNIVFCVVNKKGSKWQDTGLIFSIDKAAVLEMHCLLIIQGIFQGARGAFAVSLGNWLSLYRTCSS